MKTINIKDIHKNNFKLIAKYNLKVGDCLARKESNIIHANIIKHIHSLYGWVVVDYHDNRYDLKQDLSNIEDFDVHTTTKQ